MTSEAAATAATSVTGSRQAGGQGSQIRRAAPADRDLGRSATRAGGKRSKVARWIQSSQILERRLPFPVANVPRSFTERRRCQIVEDYGRYNPLYLPRSQATDGSKGAKAAKRQPGMWQAVCGGRSAPGSSGSGWAAAGGRAGSSGSRWAAGSSGSGGGWAARCSGGRQRRQMGGSRGRQAAAAAGGRQPVGGRRPNAAPEVAPTRDHPHPEPLPSPAKSSAASQSSLDINPHRSWNAIHRIRWCGFQGRVWGVGPPEILGGWLPDRVVRVPRSGVWWVVVGILGDFPPYSVVWVPRSGVGWRPA